MPNWKTYESSVRLLSAIVAAHPGLKLNYDDVARFYGGDAKYKAVWSRMTQIKNTAKLLTAAVDNGQDPINVEISDTRGSTKAQGSDWHFSLAFSCSSAPTCLALFCNFYY
ncbi:hypothetical protein LOCC1_G001882 [Lachnellula occidentalis]|uniref:Uncharacterized protein n=1 Tax=Lachnellula occidentalis TaxID=215460 RepID=A0A8H8S4Y6_9HELO|nr:hypothetical protein LOCC1_G001882 [Lachnellula occidentalis]